MSKQCGKRNFPRKNEYTIRCRMPAGQKLFPTSLHFLTAFVASGIKEATRRGAMEYLGKIRNVVIASGVLAVVGMLFLERAQEWQKGLTGEFIVYGQQTGGTGPGAAFSRAISEVAVGNVGNGFYTTTVQ